MKKRLYTLLLSAVCVMPTMAQDGSLPMLEEGRVWNDMLLHPGGNPQYTNLYGMPCEGELRKYYVDGDSVVGDNTYKKVYGGIRPELMRQDGPRIYLYDQDLGGEERLAYDFGREEGDTIDYLEYDFKMVVNHVDTVLVDGIFRRRMEMYFVFCGLESDEKPGIFADIWVEGIGGAATSPWFDWSAFMTSGSGMLQSCVQDGRVLFTWDDFFALSITSSIPTTNKPDNRKSDGIYDLKGTRLPETPSKGLYIKDGRKQLAQ